MVPPQLLEIRVLESYTLLLHWLIVNGRKIKKLQWLIVNGRKRKKLQWLIVNGRKKDVNTVHTLYSWIIFAYLKLTVVLLGLDVSSRLGSRVVSVHCSNALLSLLMVRPRLSCRLPCSQLVKRWRSMHCRQACVYTATRSREVHMYGNTCGVRGKPPVVRLPKKPSA